MRGVSAPVKMNGGPSQGPCSRSATERPMETIKGCAASEGAQPWSPWPAGWTCSRGQWEATLRARGYLVSHFSATAKRLMTEAPDVSQSSHPTVPGRVDAPRRRAPATQPPPRPPASCAACSLLSSSLPVSKSLPLQDPARPIKVLAGAQGSVRVLTLSRRFFHTTWRLGLLPRLRPVGRSPLPPRSQTGHRPRGSRQRLCEPPPGCTPSSRTPALGP